MTELDERIATISTTLTPGLPRDRFRLRSSARRRSIGGTAPRFVSIDGKIYEALRGAGWRLIGERGGGSWNTPSRPRVDTAPLQRKLLWEASA